MFGVISNNTQKKHIFLHVHPLKKGWTLEFQENDKHSNSPSKTSQPLLTNKTSPAAPAERKKCSQEEN